MKLTLFLVVLGVGAALSTPVNEEKHYKTADAAFLDKQAKIMPLFKHIQQPSMLEEHVKLYKSIEDPTKWLEDNKALFEKPEVVEKMIEFFHNSYMLPKHRPFTIMYSQHLEQAIALFKLFYYAKDFDSFHHTAVVMRHFVNEGMFLYSASVAIVHREDCYGIILPPIYEIYPWYFFPGEAIQEAYRKKMMHDKTEDDRNTVNHHHVYANYSGHYLNLHPEQKSLSYFMEDVGVNSFVYYFHLHYPFWMDGEEFHIKNDYRGELFLVAMQSATARYYLERLSHGRGQIPTFDWEEPFVTPYYPSLQFPWGMPLQERPSFAHLQDSYYQYGQHVNSKYALSMAPIKDFERRLMDAIDAGVVYDSTSHKMEPIYDESKHNEFVNKFGNLLQHNNDSQNPLYYKHYIKYATRLLGYGTYPLNWMDTVPTAMENMETTMRDPASYQLFKRIMIFYEHFQNTHIKPYEKSDLLFPGVTIEKVEMDRLITYFDNFYSDISNAMWENHGDLTADKFKIYAIQKRMNHKPFTYKIHVNSNQETDAMVKVFLGPKYDEFGRYINISENRWNFVPIDAFKMHLTAGQNVIKRSSQESEYFAHDKTTYEELYKKVMGAKEGHGEFHVTGKESYFYFPDRMMLPMGSYNGMTYQFYFIVYPFTPYTGPKADLTYFYPRPGTGGGFIDDLPVYYPFDRPIKYGKMFAHEVPNSYFYETKIYHRTAEEAQVPQAHH